MMSTPKLPHSTSADRSTKRGTKTLSAGPRRQYPPLWPISPPLKVYIRRYGPKTSYFASMNTTPQAQPQNS